MTIAALLGARLRVPGKMFRLGAGMAAGLSAALTGVPVMAPAGPAYALGQPPQPAAPRHDSLAYRLSLGLPAVRADGAYARGATGKGVTIAMIDTGVGESGAALGRLSPDSTDLIGARQAGDLHAEHGAQTATLLGGALDRAGIIGVAYGATVMAIRADIDGSCEQRCAVHGADLARGIDYALAHGARIIGVPLVGAHRLPSVEPALARAAAAGAVLVIAAGNDGAAEPAWPARYASDPHLAGAILVAGASTRRGTLAAWSSKAAAAADRYIVAPGDDLPVACGVKYCSLASGTSYAVPFVAGALSLVMSRYPALGAQEAAEILLQSARRFGAGGEPIVSGRGRLDITRAMRLAERVAQDRDRAAG